MVAVEIGDKSLRRKHISRVTNVINMESLGLAHVKEAEKNSLISNSKYFLVSIYTNPVNVNNYLHIKNEENEIQGG